MLAPKRVKHRKQHHPSRSGKASGGTAVAFGEYGIQALEPAYLTNPQDACWIYAGADLTGVERLTVAFGRLPFNFGLDAGHNSIILHPPRTRGGELEVRQDSCTSDPIAVAAVTPQAVGTHSELSLSLPARSGRHDLCFTFTSTGFDPMLAVDWVQLTPPGATAVAPGRP